MEPINHLIENARYRIILGLCIGISCIMLVSVLLNLNNVFLLTKTIKGIFLFENIRRLLVLIFALIILYLYKKGYTMISRLLLIIAISVNPFLVLLVEKDAILASIVMLCIYFHLIFL